MQEANWDTVRLLSDRFVERLGTMQYSGDPLFIGASFTRQGNGFAVKFNDGSAVTWIPKVTNA